MHICATLAIPQLREENMSGHVSGVYYDNPRGVQIRLNSEMEIVAGAREGDPHSAVYGGVFVLADSITDAQKLIAQWPRIAAAIGDARDRILSED